MSEQVAVAPRAFGVADFRQLFMADTISQAGTQLTSLAVPFIAAVLLRATPFELSLVGAAGTLPALVATLPAGVLLDRVRRGRAMVICDLGRMLVLATVPVAWWARCLTVAQLAAVAFIAGTFTAIFNVSRESYLPQLIEGDLLVDGNAILQSVSAVAQVGGAAMAGLVIGLVTAPGSIALDAASFAGSAAFLVRIRRAAPSPQSFSPRPRIGHDLRSSLAFISRHPLLRPIALASSTTFFFFGMLVTMMLYLLTRTLGYGAIVVGIVGSVISLGGLFGAFMTSRIVRRIGEARSVWLPVALTAPFAVSVPLMTRGPQLWICTVLFAVAIAGSVVFDIAGLSIRQRVTPPHLLGRVSATMRFLSAGLTPVGTIAGGALSSYVGVRPTLWVAACGYAIGFVPALVSQVRSTRQ